MYVSYASANRDEEAFEAPFEFRPNRKPIKHVSFGFGVHQCLGNMLARQEMRFFLEDLVARIDTLALDGKPALTKSRWVQGLKTLPIRYSCKYGAPRPRERRVGAMTRSGALKRRAGERGVGKECGGEGR